jgi:hypothetical protein
MEILKVLHVGRYTIAQVKDTESGILGIGISRLADNDRYNKNIAEKIALGRAEKAVELKKANKPLHQLLMG